MLVKISNVLELVGLALILIAAAAWDWRALAFLLGSLMVAAGYLIDTPDNVEVEP